jgi:hypothetical protein
MLKLPVRRAALILAGAGIALAAVALPAAAGVTATSRWRISATFGAGKRDAVVVSVAAVSARDAWAVGLTAPRDKTTGPIFVRHWNGAAWRLVTLPAAVARIWDRPVAAGAIGGALVTASSGRNVWIVSAAGRYLRRDGTDWTTGLLPGRRSGDLLLSSVRAISPANVWVFGSAVGKSGRFAPYAAHFAGKKWTRVHIPGSGELGAVTVVSASDMWAVETVTPANGLQPASAPTSKVRILHWTGSKAGWRAAPVQPTAALGNVLLVDGVLAQPDGTIWIAGETVGATTSEPTALLARWRPGGASWTLVKPPASAAMVLALSADGQGGAWAAALNAVRRQPGELWHLNGTTWSKVMPAFGGHRWGLEQFAVVPHIDAVWGVGVLEKGSAADGLIAIDGPAPR